MQRIMERKRKSMTNPALIDQFLKETELFEEKIKALEAGEITRKEFKGISGGFGSYAQKEGGYMLRLRLPAGRISRETLEFLADKSEQYQFDLLKITTCQTIQVHNLSAKDVVSFMRDCLRFGIITKGGGGDHPRNVMASPLSGVEKEELFDVLPYAQAAGDYLVSRMSSLHLPRKLKVGFSNTRENLTHATFRDLGFAARQDHTFSVYCAGGLGPNPKLGVLVAEQADPGEVTLYISAMIRLFVTYGNYQVRAKSRTRYLQDTLGEEGIQREFARFLAEARQEEDPLPISSPLLIRKNPEGTIQGERILEQKQEGLYTVSYHPIGGCLDGKKIQELWNAIKDFSDTELRLSPEGTLYVINLSAKEVLPVLEATKDGAQTLFENSVSCIGVPICQHGLRCSQGLLRSCVERIRQENLKDGVLPQMHISGCPSSCGSHQAAALGFVGHAKKIQGEMKPAFRLFTGGSQTDPGARLGEEAGVLAEAVIPEFLAALGRKIQDADSVFETWYPAHIEEFQALVREYADRAL